jgi:hypothetical protein
MLTPDNSLRNFRFCTLAGVEDVRVVGTHKIIGRFQENLKEIYGPRRKRRLVEDFLNWPSNLEGLLRFARKYGPLRISPVAGAEFEIPWGHWMEDQRRLQSLWQRQRIIQPAEWEPRGGSLSFREGWLTYTTSNLYMFLHVDLITSETKRLRFCKRPDCRNPYFIAGHLKQRFCSDLCAEWGQREWKKQWWTEHGTAWREKREESKLKKRGGKNGTRETR